MIISLIRKLKAGPQSQWESMAQALMCWVMALDIIIGSNDPRTFITEGRGNEGSKIIAAFIGLVVSPTGLKSIYYLLSHFELHLFFP